MRLSVGIISGECGNFTVSNKNNVNLGHNVMLLYYRCILCIRQKTVNFVINEALIALFNKILQ